MRSVINATSHPRDQTSSSAKAFLWSELSVWWQSVLCAILCTFLLGLVSTLVASLIAPCLTLLNATEHQIYTTNELFGAQLSRLASALGFQTHYPKETYLHILPIALLLLSLLKTSCSTAQNFIWENTAERISLSLRKKLAVGFTNIHPFNYSLHAASQVEKNLASICANDIRTLRDFIVHFYGGLPRVLTESIFLCALLVALSPKLFAIFLLGVAPLLGVVNKIGRRLRHRSKLVLSNYAELAEWMQQRLFGIETIKHYRTEHLENTSFTKEAENYLHRQRQAVKTRAKISPVMEAATFLALAGVLTLAFQEIADGTLGQVVALSFFSTLAFFAQSAANIGKYIAIQKESRPALERIHQNYTALLSLSQSESQPEPISQNFSSSQICCTMHQVSLRYPDQEAFLNHFSVTFLKGKIYAVTGPSGRGKTSLALALLRQIPCYTGRIHYNFDPSLTPPGYVPQHPVLSPSSIGELIAYPHERVDTKQALQALEQVGLASWVANLPDQLKSSLTGSAEQISGGQKQRILIARAIYHSPPLMVIDEGTSALDSENETQVIQALKNCAKQGTTVVMIAHRATTVAACDQVIRL